VSIRVAIADDQQLVRTGFRMILATEPDIEVVAEATTGLEAIAAARELHPDVVLMDIRMPDLDGIQATRQITEANQQPPCRVLILTTFDLDEYVFDALRAGASGFLLKDAPSDQLVDGVRIIASGEALLAPSITRRLIEQFATTAPPPTPPPALRDLTPRELEIFKLVATGRSNREIAADLVIGETTVKTHVTRALRKLDLRDRVQAAVLAYETGILKPGSLTPTDTTGQSRGG
jgi:DNA-binding NarL/FixJ family response regulator